ncbi:MAG TPA: hypothetical protein DCY97_13895 [Marinilabiliales bacterium]|nr:hypothetical protein [Marinilabiliales bacterium]
MKIKNHYLIWLLVVSTSCSSRIKISEGDFKDTFDYLQVMKSGDISRTIRPDTAVLNLYQGNGRFGCSYGPMGLHNNPEKTELEKYGKTQYMHIHHFARAKFGSDYLLPLARIYWEDEPNEVTNYNQCQSFCDGTITTSFEEGKNKVTVTTWFDPVERDLAGIKIKVEGKAPAIIIAPSEKLNVHYKQELLQTASSGFESGLWKINLSCLNVSSNLFIKTDAETKLDKNRIYINLKEGDNTILISANSNPQTTPEESLSRTTDWWHSKWGNTACLSLPDGNAQKMWVRSMAYLLSSYNDDKLGTAPPSRFTGIGWPFPFPEDLSFIHAALLYTGNMDIAKSWIEYWAERIQGIKDYTKRLFGVEGVYSPWVFPYGEFEGYHDPVPPNKCYYEIHNSGYLARMAYETAIFVNDRNWTQKYALPIIRETALFYKNFCKKEADGLWHLFITPSMGQDEEGGVNQKDYLCALTSAEYCFQKAIEYKLDTDGFYKTALEEGLAFPVLKSKQGFYFTNQGTGMENFGKQKHPIQLNPLAFLPIDKDVSTPAAIAYKLRYEITEDSYKPHFSGWTLGEFLLAGSRIGDVEGWKKDWANLRKSDYVDADWIQVYESSRSHNHSFYVTSSGLMVQTLLNNLVTDWFGKLEIAKCNPWNGKIFFRNIYSLLGVKVSGSLKNNNAELLLEAWKDCKFDIKGKKIKMVKGETKTINLNLNE